MTRDGFLKLKSDQRTLEVGKVMEVWDYTIPYHDKSDGQIERCNRTLLNMLGTLS
mgnify:CR=1 FL=1